jgi:hypothetical protein
MAFGDADASTPAPVKASVAGKSVTTASFTPPAGAVLYAHAFHDTAGGNLTSTSQITDSLGLTWTLHEVASKADDGTGYNDGHQALWTATATGVAMTVTTTGTNTNNPAGLYVRVVVGADTTTPVDTHQDGTSDNAIVSQGLTTVTDGARGVVMATDWNLAANMTAGANQTAVWADGIGAPDMRVYVGIQNAVPSPAGSVTMSTATPTTGNQNNWIAYAMRPAAGGATNLSPGNAAVSAAGNAATLSASPAAGNAAAAVAANAATLRGSLAATHGAVSAAANPAALTSSLGASSGAVAVGAFDASVTSGSTLTTGGAAVSIGASSGTLTSSLTASGAAVGVGASSAALTSSISSTFAAVSVGAFDATVTGGATALNVGGAIISVGAFDATLTGGTVPAPETPVTGGWQGLLDILNDIRDTHAEQVAATPTACPRCGEPLYSTHGALRCRFDGWTTGPVTL